jgi:hypothetical protein
LDCIPSDCNFHQHSLAATISFQLTMLFQTIIPSFLAIGAMAAPSLKRDTCSFIYEPQLFAISSQTPQTSTGEFTSPFFVWSQDGKTDLVASFRTVPSNSYGCTLQLDYRPGNNPFSESDSHDATVINVFQVSDGGNFPQPIDWENTYSRTGSLVGTFHFPSGAQAAIAQIVNINSFACSEVLTYRFSVADPNAIGGVSLDDTLSSGLRIAHNC